MRRLPPLTALEAFVQVARTGSVKAAAADIGVTEAAVSLHVGQLRRELGDQLFNRTASGLAFTIGFGIVVVSLIPALCGFIAGRIRSRAGEADAVAK